MDGWTDWTRTPKRSVISFDVHRAETRNSSLGVRTYGILIWKPETAKLRERPARKLGVFLRLETSCLLSTEDFIAVS